MSDGKRLCVFCGSSSPADARYGSAATRLGTLLGAAGIELVYGGGRVGLMGLLADAALAAGGRVTGIIPAGLHDREIAHPRLQELIVVSDMQERKRMMFERSDAVAVLPGGLGTLDEAFEAITLRQLHMIDLPIVLIDLDGFWQPLLKLIDHVVGAGFAASNARDLYHVVSRVEDTIPGCFDRISRPSLEKPWP
jgi:uncharacterized protein (TIGR00730 family)